MKCLEDKKIIKCPRCGNTRIVKRGIYYQCISGYDEKHKYHSGCGYLGIEEDFNIIKQKKLNFK